MKNKRSKLNKQSSSNEFGIDDLVRFINTHQEVHDFILSLQDIKK